MYAVNKTVMLKGYETTSVTYMTLCHASGMIILCILGHFFWAEKLTLLSLSGILATVLSILMIKDTPSGKQSLRCGGILAGLIVLLTSGGVMVAQKIMGLYFTE